MAEADAQSRSKTVCHDGLALEQNHKSEQETKDAAMRRLGDAKLNKKLAMHDAMDASVQR